MNAQVQKFRQSLPAEDSELVICPEGCLEQHDAKWHGVMVPMPKKVEAQIQERHPLEERILNMKPKVIPTFVDPFPSLLGKEWREAVKREGKSCWEHREYELTGTQVMVGAPTPKQLKKMASMYGVKSPATLVAVADVADAYGIALDVPRSALKPKKKPRNPSRKERAQQLLDLGHGWDVIEEELDLNPRVSKEMKEEMLGVGAA